MMYPFLTLDDNTEIVHSEMLSDNTVKVYVEKPDEKDGFHSAFCFLPEYRWDEIKGFSKSEIDNYQSIIETYIKKNEKSISKFTNLFQNRVDIAKSLFGILPGDMSEDDVKKRLERE